MFCVSMVSFPQPPARGPQGPTGSRSGVSRGKRGTPRGSEARARVLETESARGIGLRLRQDVRQSVTRRTGSVSLDPIAWTR